MTPPTTDSAQKAPAEEADTALPPKDELISLLEHESYGKVLADMTQMEFVALDPDPDPEPGETSTPAPRTLRINGNTPWEKTLTLQPDGLVHSEHNDVLDMPIRAPGNPVFRQAWNNLINHASAKIREHAESVMGPGALTLIEEDPDVRSVMNQTVRGVCSHTGMGYVRSPTQAGDHLLHRLLGKEKVSEALKIAGLNASPRHVNLIARNREAITKAHRQNPNAVVLWMNSLRWEQLPESIEAEAVLREAQDIVHRSLPPGETDISPEKLWEYFNGLNQKAVNDHPDQDALLHAALTGARAGAQPAHTGVKLIALRLREFEKAPAGLQKMFVQEGQRSIKKKNGQQRDLAETMNRLLDLGTERLNAAARGKNAWAAWKSMAKPTKDESPEASQENRQPKSKDWDRNRATQMQNQQRLEQIIHENLNEIADKIDGAVAIKVKPGRKVALSIPAGGILSVEKTPTGTIKVHGNGYFCGHLELPDPQGKGESGNITTRGWAARLAGETAWEALEDAWEGEDLPSVNRARATYVKAAAAELTEERLERNSDEELSLKLQEGLRTLLDPEAWTTIKERFGRVSPKEYNRQVKAARNGNRGCGDAGK